MTSKNSRRKARELAFFAMFSAETGKQDIDYSLRKILESDESEGIRGIITQKVLVWKKNARSIDNIIESCLKRNKLEDLAKVALVALRLGFCEMEYLSDIPPEVAINEAVELTKTYGDPDLAHFVNGIMDTHLKGLKLKGDYHENGKE